MSVQTRAPDPGQKGEWEKGAEDSDLTRPPHPAEVRGVGGGGWGKGSDLRVGGERSGVLNQDNVE
jgi:hypothetical protein